MSTLADLQRRNIAQMEVAAAAEQNAAEDNAAKQIAAEHEASTPNPDANYTTILQSDKPTNSQTDKPTDNHTDLLTDIPTNQQARKPASKKTNGVASKATSNATSKKRVSKPVPAPPEPPARPVRVDGRTVRPRQETADQTMVTSMRLAVSTLELLDDYCYRHRRRKQDVVQAALDLYFAEDAESE